MENSMLYIIIALFVSMLIVNLFFRLKVMRAYRDLVRAGVEIRARDMLNNETLENQVIPANKAHEKEIRTFLKHLKNGFKMTSVLLGLVVLFGYILMKTRS